MKTIRIAGQKRRETGKTASRRLRSEGFVPCELYGKEGNISFKVFYADFKELVYTPETYKVLLDIDGSMSEAIMKEIQFDPLSDAILHIDFQAITDNQEIKIALPIHFVGNAVGVREGGKLTKKLRKLNVKGIAKNVPAAMEVDVSALTLGKSLRVKDVPAQNLIVLNSPDLPIATVEVPRGLKGKEEEAATATTAPAAAAPKA